MNEGHLFASPGANPWTAERLGRLGYDELAQLAANAERLGESDLAARCRELLSRRPKGGGGANGAKARGAARLVARSHAFAARGVHLKDPARSWSGVRAADGKVVFAIWQPSVLLRNGSCACLLWAPNREGGRPWSDSEAGRERLEHCKAASHHAGSEGLLVQGTALDGWLPEDRARSVLGVDLGALVRLAVVANGEEFWGTWGKKRADALSQKAA